MSDDCPLHNDSYKENHLMYRSRRVGFLFNPSRIIVLLSHMVFEMTCVECLRLSGHEYILQIHLSSHWSMLKLPYEWSMLLFAFMRLPTGRWLSMIGRGRGR
jgi:hypothetical protein